MFRCGVFTPFLSLLLALSILPLTRTRAGDIVTGSIHGFKFHDLDADGIYAPAKGDVPFEGIPFELLDAEGNAVDAISSNADGEIWFTDLVPGEYTVREQVEFLPSILVPTTLTSVTLFVGSGQELVWADGAAMLGPGDPQYEVLVGDALVFGNSIIVPEPSTLVLFSVLGMIGSAGRLRRRHLAKLVKGRVHS